MKVPVAAIAAAALQLIANSDSLIKVDADETVFYVPVPVPEPLLCPILLYSALFACVQFQQGPKWPPANAELINFH